MLRQKQLYLKRLGKIYERIPKTKRTKSQNAVIDIVKKSDNSIKAGKNQITI